MGIPIKCLHGDWVLQPTFLSSFHVLRRLWWLVSQPLAFLELSRADCCLFLGGSVAQLVPSSPGQSHEMLCLNALSASPYQGPCQGGGRRLASSSCLLDFYQLHEEDPLWNPNVWSWTFLFKQTLSHGLFIICPTFLVFCGGQMYFPVTWLWWDYFWILYSISLSLWKINPVWQKK